MFKKRWMTLGKNKINVYFTEQNVCTRNVFIVRLPTKKCISCILANKNSNYLILFITLIKSYLSEYTVNAVYKIQINICSYCKEQNTIKFIKFNNL